MKRREPRRLATPQINAPIPASLIFYFEAAAAGAADAAAAGFMGADAAIAGEGIAAIADACTCDFIEAFDASFACFLQRYTLDVEMFRSLAMSFACFPLLTSFITASQSTLLVA